MYNLKQEWVKRTGSNLIMSIIEESLNIVNVYEQYQHIDYRYIYRYFEKNNIGYEDILLYSNYLEGELYMVKEIEQDHCYNKQICTKFSIIPKKYELMISKEYFDQFNELDPELMELVGFDDNVIEVHLSGYKFQLRFILKVLDQILADSKIWNHFIYELTNEY